MTQTRSLLLIAWLILAFFLWDAWQKDYVLPPPAATVADQPAGDIPSAPLETEDAVPTAPGAEIPATAPTGAPPLTIRNDLLQLTLDGQGGTLLRADLVAYRDGASEASHPVQLLSQERERWFVAQTGWTSSDGRAPSHQSALQPVAAPAADAGAAPAERHFSWSDGQGLSLRRSYRLVPGSYVLEVRDEWQNSGAAAWRANAYRQLMRVPPPVKGSALTNPEAYSFVGAAWYSPQDKFEKLAFDDFADEPLDKQAAGGWIAMLQHHFLAAWIPSSDEANMLSSGEKNGRYFVRALGPALTVEPGRSVVSTARLYLGPKLPEALEQVAPGLDLTLDYGVFTVLAQPLHLLLSWLHRLTGNWGWAIVLLVVIIKGALFKLSEKQYQSFAKMRRVQPRIEALKERYGEDRQKFQMAMMELYKKEKINPMGGCLPILVQIPVFFALYSVLQASVELRQAPWIGWIQNLTAPDPYFVLPVINLATMWLTQKLSPTPGMDPVQKKMMQIMPLVFGVMMAFFPAGLVLYWATNGALGLLQQWVIMRRHGEPAKV